jgi:ubiquitin C-terminal hydrolase
VAKQLFLSGKSDPVDPRALLAVFKTKFSAFADGGQHDAQEVIVCLIDIFEKSLGKEFITEIFNGEEIQETVFPGGVSKRSEIFTTLILDVNSETDLVTLLKEREKHVGISDYIDENGNKHNVAAIGRRVIKWPKILCFTFSMYSRKFPIEIPTEIYDRKLFAVVLHSGMMFGGHYAIAVKRYGKWYIKDDDTVSELNEPPRKGPFYMALYRP